MVGDGVERSGRAARDRPQRPLQLDLAALLGDGVDHHPPAPADGDDLSAPTQRRMPTISVTAAARPEVADALPPAISPRGRSPCRRAWRARRTRPAPARQSREGERRDHPEGAVSRNACKTRRDDAGLARCERHVNAAWGAVSAYVAADGRAGGRRRHAARRGGADVDDRGDGHGNARRASAVAELDILTMGITFTVYSDGQNIDRAWPFDIIPRIIPGTEWDRIERRAGAAIAGAQHVHRRPLQRAA